MSDDAPPLLRPIPRRPFDLNLTSPTPPDEDSAPPSPIPDLQSSRFLNAQYYSQPGASESASLSRAQSIINLTASTLFGIFSPTASDGKERFYNAGEEPDTPWGTGAQTPVKRPSLDESTYELMMDRSSFNRRHSSPWSVPLAPPPSTASLVFSLALRAALLFTLGMGYGALVARLHTERNLAPSYSVQSIIDPDHGWKYMAFWGASGVALGALLPLFDKLWADAFGGEAYEAAAESDTSRRPGQGTDWALVVRGVGAFMGIVFAIRKLPWASTLQVSLTLALVNPFLWYLIDRSKPGFLLSAVVGLTGSAVLLGVNPSMMPTPSASPYRNESAARFTEPLTLGGLASQETIETGIWMISVLFCSCVCFGNIGRRLALNRSAAAKGRWGDVR